MKPSRELFWRQVAMKFDKLNVALLQNELASFAQGNQEYVALQEVLLREARTEWERRHIRRLVAHNFLTFAYFRARTWVEYQRALSRVRRLGHPSLEYRMHAACETLEWAADRDPARAPLGWMMVEDAERRLRCLRRGSPVRKQALAAIASVKKRVTQKGLTPPTTPTQTPGTAGGTLGAEGGRPVPLRRRATR